jgi:3-dehydroquinate dehydratase / shikimate dehydrogenase
MAPFGKQLERLCAVVAVSTADEMSKLVLSAIREARTVELRLDWLRNDAERVRFLNWLRKSKLQKTTFLVACRRREGGGKFAGSIERELYWLRQARDAVCQWCDLEIETLGKLPNQSAKGMALPRRVMLSLHDFKRTPKLPRTMKPDARRGIDAVKIAAEARTINDSVRLLKLARRSGAFVASPMGEIGLPARILSLREGSALAYAPVAAATAPGQVSLHEMKYLYRAHELTHRTRVYGVIGDPVGHSLSPVLHNTGFVTRKIDAVYLPFLVYDLRDFLAAVPEFGIRGFSITHPHKQMILKYLKECDPVAAEIGAVNTVVVRRDGSLFGSNTDHSGLLRALETKMRVKGRRALIIGAGGVARATAFALSGAGANVAIYGRRESVVRELAGAFGAEVIPRRALRTENFDIVVNATPVGMLPNVNESPLTPAELRCSLVMDLITRPRETKLLKIAARKGIATIPGVEMLLAQGYAQWELWVGKPAPEAAIRRAVLGALGAADKSAQRG